jgi:glycosyltransferase involved in cell wall biosynthesis
MPNIKEKANIICLSNQLWDYPLWTNKKHVMSRLAQRGYPVVFVDPPINTGRLFFKQLMAKKWSVKRLNTLSYEDGGVTVFSPLNPVPANEKLAKTFCERINKLAKAKFDPSCKTVLWVYHVEIENIEVFLKELKYDILVYDCVDNYTAFPKYDTPEKKQKITAQEDFVVKKADIVFATAPGLVDRLSRLNPKTFYTPNVGDYERFSKVTELANQIPQDIQSIPRPRIGFTGAVDDYKFDKELVKRVASDYPSYSFIVIGPLALKDKEASVKELGFEGIPNIYFLGTRDYSLMPRYFAGFDAMLIPYQLNDYTVGGCFPIKFHEGLAAGLPVIVTNLPAYRPFADVCYISKSYNEFSQNIRHALEQNNDQLKHKRQAVARENDWEGKVDKMLSLIDTEVLK